jgi:hypothetical protein
LQRPSDYGQLAENAELAKVSCFVRFVCLILCCCLSGCPIAETRFAKLKAIFCSLLRFVSLF